MKIVRNLLMIFTLVFAALAVPVSAQSDEAAMWGYFDPDAGDILVFGVIDAGSTSTAKMAVIDMNDIMFDELFDRDYDISTSRAVPKNCSVASGISNGDETVAVLCYKGSDVYVVMSTLSEKKTLGLMDDFLDEGEPVVPDNFREVDADEL